MASPNCNSRYESFENAICNGITALVFAFSCLSPSKSGKRELEEIKKKINSAFEEVNTANKKAKAQEEELICQIQKLNTEKEGMEHAKRVKEKDRDKLSKMLEHYKKDEQENREIKNTLEEKLEEEEDTDKKKIHHTILKLVYAVILFLYILFDKTSRMIAYDESMKTSKFQEVLMDMFQMPFNEIFRKLQSITIFIAGGIWYFLNDMGNKLLVSQELIFEHRITINELENKVSRLEKKKKETEETIEGIKTEIENFPNMSDCERKIQELNEEKERTTKYEKCLFFLAKKLNLPEENYSYKFLKESLGEFCADWEQPWVQEGKGEVSNTPVRKEIREQIKYLDDDLKKKKEF